VYETESQAMLNTLTEHNFQDAFKIWQALVTVHTCGRVLFWGPIGLNLVFDQMTAPVPEIMDGYLYMRFQRMWRNFNTVS
jgi:hypothetical protein